MNSKINFQKPTFSLNNPNSSSFHLIDSPELLVQLSSLSKNCFLVTNDTSSFQHQLGQGTSARIFSAKLKPRTKYEKMKDTLTKTIEKINQMDKLKVSQYFEYQQNLFSVFFSDLIQDISKQCVQKGQILKLLWATMFQLTHKITNHLVDVLKRKQSSQLKQMIDTHESYQKMIERDKKGVIQIQQALQNNDMVLSKLVKQLRQKRKQNKKLKKIIATLLQKINEKEKNYLELENEYLSAVLSNKSASKQKAQLLMQRKINLSEQRRSILKLKNSAKQVAIKVKSQFGEESQKINLKCKQKLCNRFENIMHQQQDIDEILDEFQFEHQQAKTEFKSEIQFARIHFEPVVIDASTNTNGLTKIVVVDSSTQVNHYEKLQYDMIMNQQTSVDSGLMSFEEKIVQTNQRSLFQSYRFKIYSQICETILPAKEKKQSSKSLLKHKIKKPKLTKNSIRKQLNGLISFDKNFNTNYSEIQSRDIDGISSINDDINYQAKFNRIPMPEKRLTANQIYQKSQLGSKSLFQKQAKAALRQSENFLLNKVLVSNTSQQPIFSINQQNQKPSRLKANKSKKHLAARKQGLDIRRMKTQQTFRVSKIHHNEINSSYFLETSELMKKIGKSTHRKKQKYNKANVFLKDLQYLPADTLDSSQRYRNITDFIDFFKNDLQKETQKRAETPGSTNINLIIKYIGQAYSKALQLISKNNFLTNMLLPFSKVVQLAYGNNSKQETFQKMIQLIKQIKRHQDNYIFYTFLFISGLIEQQQSSGITVTDIIIFLNMIEKLSTNKLSTNNLLNTGKFSELSTNIGKFTTGIKQIFQEFGFHQNLISAIEQMINDYTNSYVFENSQLHNNSHILDEKMEIELLKASFLTLKELLKIKSKIKYSLQLSNDKQVPRFYLGLILNAQINQRTVKQFLKDKYLNCKPKISVNQFIQICLQIGFTSIEQLEKQFLMKYQLTSNQFKQIIKQFDYQKIIDYVELLEGNEQQRTQKQILSQQIKIEKIDKRILSINKIEQKVSSLFQLVIGVELNCIYHETSKSLVRQYMHK